MPQSILKFIENKRGKQKTISKEIIKKVKNPVTQFIECNSHKTITKSFQTIVQTHRIAKLLKKKKKVEEQKRTS